MKTRTSSTLGLGLRGKLVLGFVGLLAILVAVGVESISLLTELGGSIDVILRENYKSVIACGRMKEALERLDSGALFALAGETQKGRELAVQNRPRFETALATELGNITLPGEGERAARLRSLFASYTPVLERVLDDATATEQRHALYFARLYPVFLQIKSTADQILEMNQQSMVSSNDQARAVAAAAGRRMAWWLLLGTAFAGLCVAFLSSAIHRPLQRLARAAQRIEGGDLDFKVEVTSRDELGELAAAFNEMAAGLRELRESDQAHLLHARRMSQLAIDSLPEAVLILSSHRIVSVANRAASFFLGVQPGQPVPDRHDPWLQPLLFRAESGRVHDHLPATGIQLPAVSPDRFFLPRAEALRDERGRAEGFVVVLEDLTRLRRGGEVHAGLLENAARDLMEARGQEERVAEIAANLLAMARLEGTRQRLQPEPVLPGDVIDAAVHRIASRFQEEQVKLETSVDLAARPVLADRERAEVVLSSLLRNALAHTPAGGSVTVRAEPEEGRTRFTITDTGRGIPAAHRERLFEPFYQVPGTEDLGGVGLGLSNARDIVQAHGGEIHCESEEGQGTTFWFTLPAAVD